MQKCKELQLLLMLIKPLMPHKIMNFIQWKKSLKRSCIYLFDTVQRHHSISGTSKLCLNGSEHQAVGLSCVIDLFSYIIICCLMRGIEARRGLAPWKLNRSLIALPLSTHYDHTTSLKYLVAPYQVKYPLICNKYIRKQPCTV